MHHDSMCSYLEKYGADSQKREGEREREREKALVCERTPLRRAGQLGSPHALEQEPK